MKQVMKFLREDDGATAIEYGLIAGLIAVAIVAILGTLGTNLSSIFKVVSDKLGDAKTPAAAT